MSGDRAPAPEPGRHDEPGMPAILLVTHEFFPTRGGVGVYVYELANAAAKQGRVVRVLAPGHPRWRELDDLPVRLEAISPAPVLEHWWYLPATAVWLLANRRRLRGQVLHLCQQGPLRVMMVPGLLGLVRPKTLIVTLHGSELLQLSASRLGGRRLLGKVLAAADRIAVLSNWVKDQLVHGYPEVAGKVVVAPGAPRTEWPNPGEHTRARDSRLTVLTVGRIHPRKGQHTVLEALGRLDTGRRKTVRYVIAGPVVDPAFETRLRRQANSAGVEVIFTGDIDDDVLSRHYAAANIFALTSEPQANSVEGFGLAFLEASAAGLPILGYRTGGVEDAVRDGSTGLLVEPGDVSGLVGALTRLIDDAALRERLGANGRQWAANFSWEKCAAAVYGDLP